jgi:hypothetical protein
MDEKIGRERGEIHMARYRVTLFGRDYKAMADLVRKHKLTLDVFPHTLRQLDDGGYRVDALADDVQMRSLLEAGAVEPEAARISGYTIERHERM